MSRIFISHSSKDKIPAETLGTWLQQQGHTSYFLDFDPEKGLAGGAHWEDELYKQLRLCRAVIALISPDWLASRWCFAEVTQARAAGKPVFLVKIVACEIDGIFPDIQYVDLTTKAAEAYQRLAKGLKEVGIEPGDAFEWNPSRPPYPGLLAFEENDAAVFFGRDRDIQRSIEKLSALRRQCGAPFVLFLGASGSGKSSLVRAGLIPRLRKYQAVWLPIAPFRPQEDPMEELSIVLSQTFEALGGHRDWRSIYEQLYAPFTSQYWLAEHADKSLTGDGLKQLTRDLRILVKQQDATVLLLVDQAEELFGYSNPLKARAFLQCVRGALETSGHRLMAVATMRSDSLASFQTHEDLHDFLYEPFAVDPIPLRELPQIIDGPARLAGVELEPGLVNMMVQDAVTSDALPLLAFTLRELYEKYGKDKRLEIAEYENMGRLEGSVSRAANSLIAALSPREEELDALRIAFVPAMVRVNEDGQFIRRRALWLDLPARAHRLLQYLIDARLLVSRDEGGERIIEVAHEALMRTWPLLKNWLRADRDNIRVLDDMQHAAEQWQSHNREPSWLIHHGERLTAAEAMTRISRFGEQVSHVATNYLEACKLKSQQERERAERQAIAERRRLEAEAKTARRTRIAAYVISTIALLAISAAIIAWYEAGLAEKQRNAALANQSKALSSVSREQTDKGFATLGTLLSLKALPKKGAYGQRQFASAEAALLKSLLAQREKYILTPHPFSEKAVGTGGINSVRFSSETGEQVVTASRDGSVNIWNVGTGKLAQRLMGHEKQVYIAAFSPDNQLVVTASSDKTARLWNVNTGQTIFTLSGHAGEVYWADFSPTGAQVVTTSSDTTARIWDLKLKTSRVLAGHTKEVFHASFSGDGERIVTASNDGSARLWDVKTGKLISILEGHTQGVIKANFSPDGNYIVTASLDKTARLWDGFSGKFLRSLQGHKAALEQATFSPNGNFIVTTSADGTARVWSLNEADSVYVLSGHKGHVYDANFSSESRLLVTAADDGTARLWDVNSQKVIAVFGGHNARIWSVRFSPDGKYVATASEDNTARLWDVEPNIKTTELKGHNSQVQRALFMGSKSEHIVTVSADHTARIWDIASGKNAVLQHSGAVWYAVVSPDGQRLVTTSMDGTAKLWDADGVLLHTFRGHQGLVTHAHFSQDNKRIITAGPEGTARIWDLATGKTLGVLQGHNGAVNFAEFSRDKVSSRILTASEDGTARLWDGRTTEVVAVMDKHTGPINNAAFSSNGKIVATASSDKTIRLWDAVTGEYLRVLNGHNDAVMSVAFSRNSKFLVSASLDNTARIWDVSNGRSVRVLRGHLGEVWDASFSADERLVLTASSDGTARLWHMASGLTVATLQGHSAAVLSAVFAPDQRHIVTASWDNTARLWELPSWITKDWVEYARVTVPRPKLTNEERRLYLEELTF